MGFTVSLSGFTVFDYFVFVNLDTPTASFSWPVVVVVEGLLIDMGKMEGANGTQIQY